VILSDHLQNDLDILSVTYPHGIVNASLNGMKQKVSALPGRVYELCPLPTQIKECKSTDAEAQQDYRDYDDSCCQALEQQPLSLNSIQKVIY
jgi:hypothetical protein